MSVSFVGGTASPSGAQPAYFMTKDPIVQFVIENSKEFKNGFIHLMMCQELPGEHPRMAVPKPSPAAAVDAPESVSAPAEQPQQENGDTDVREVELSDKVEAVVWLKEHFPDKGYSAVGLHTKTAFEAACKECGVKFVFTT